MKRLLSLIIAIGFLITLVSCGQDQYSLEREFWHTKRQTDKIFKNPHASPPRQLEQAVNSLNKFIQKYPDNVLAIEAEFNIARLYIVKEEHQKAREQLKKTLNIHSESEAVSSQADFLIGNSYQIEDNWTAALQHYKKIIHNYPITPIGLEMPIYIAQYYKIKSLPEKMIISYHEAAAHYKALSDKYPNSILSLTVEKLAAQCQIAIRDWENAIITLDSIIEKYEGKANLDEVFMMMALIYNRELNDKIKAKEALEKVIKDYPQSRFINAANKLLKELVENE